MRGQPRPRSPASNSTTRHRLKGCSSRGSKRSATKRDSRQSQDGDDMEKFGPLYFDATRLASIDLARHYSLTEESKLVDCMRDVQGV